MISMSVKPRVLERGRFITGLPFRR
jgi:hypothetical protein